MAWVEKKTTKKGVRYVGRYRGPDGRKRKGPPMDTKKAAKTWAEDQEAAIRRGDWIAPERTKTTFRDWVFDWWELYTFRPTTEAVYHSIIHTHLFPTWGEYPLGTIEPMEVDLWVQRLRRRGYSEYHTQGIRRLLSTIMEDAVYYGMIPYNPARKRPRRGNEVDHTPPKRQVWTDPVRALLLAERAALLSGRDDEFIAACMFAYTGMRWAELLGLKRKYCWLKHGSIYIESTLAEVGGTFYEQPPKTPESRREIHLPDFLTDLLATWLSRDDRTYVYLTRNGAHPRKSAFARQYWRPAADGWHPPCPARNGHTTARRPVLVDATTFPGIPHTPAWPAAQPGVEFTEPRGSGWRRFPDDGAAASWLPLCPGLGPHDLRRSMRTWLTDAGIPHNAAEARMGHVVQGIDPVYNMVTPHQRQMILEALEERWWAALALRYRMAATSPVPLVQAWLEMAASRIASGDIQWDLCPPFAPQSGLGHPGGRQKKGTDLHSNPPSPASAHSLFFRTRRPLRPGKTHETPGDGLG